MRKGRSVVNLPRYRFAKADSTGFTLVELLVVIAIIGILVTLLLPAVQAARTAARRIQCMNNIKQIALAIHNYHSAHDQMPANANNYGYTGGGYSQPPSGAMNEHTNGFSWLVKILPFMEEQAIYDQLNFDLPAVSSVGNPSNRELIKTPLSNLICPEDPVSGDPVRNDLNRWWAWTAAGTNFDNNGEVATATYKGVGNHIEPPDGPTYLFHYIKYNNGNHGFPIKRQDTSFRMVTDGLSNTLMLGERSFECSRASWACSWGTHVTPNSQPITANGEDLGINSVQRVAWHPFPSDCVWMMAWLNEPYGMHSYHTQGVVCAMADGAVAFLDETMDEKLVTDLGLMRNGAPAGGFNPN
jgi:prepilin-type N-terminal cleavage/methylation domain-containing protein